MEYSCFVLVVETTTDRMEKLLNRVRVFNKHVHLYHHRTIVVIKILQLLIRMFIHF